MRKLALLTILFTAPALSFAPPKPKPSLLLKVNARKASGAVITRDGGRLYYAKDSTQLYVFDRATRRSLPVLGSMAGVGASLAVSPAGDRLAFTRTPEGGGEPQLWTVALDSKTGLATGAPMRVSVRAGRNPEFSPDGKSIAFSTPTSRVATNLVVIPANGGPERLVVETQGDIWPIVWTKTDSLYFGISFQANDAKNGVYRVKVSGGAPQIVLRTAGWGGYPGLSPDGRFILANDSTWDSVIVSTPSGRRLYSYGTEAGEPTPDMWFARGKAIGQREGTTSAVHVIDLTNAKERVVTDSANLFAPTLSPDGRRVATARWYPSAIVVSDVVAGTRKAFTVERAPRITWPMQWSPDGRLVLYYDVRGALILVDASGSTVRELAPKSSFGPLAHWRSDSRAIIYAIHESPENTDAIKKFDIHEVTLDGHDRLLHSIETQCNGGAFCGKIIDDSLVSTWINGEYRVTNFRARAVPQLIYKRDGGGQPVPTFSSNGRWMAVRHQSASDQKWSIEIMHPDGSAHRTVPVSFRVQAGGRNPWIRSDGAELIVVSPDCAESSRGGCQGGVEFYRVDVASGRATVIKSLPRAIRTDPLMVSDDGRWLVYPREIETWIGFYDFDFSEILKSVRP